MNERMEVLFGGHIGIADGKIVSISKVPPAEPPATIIDGTGMVAMPTWLPRSCGALPTT